VEFLIGPDNLEIVGFEVLTAVSMKIAASGWSHRPDDGGSKDL
jgi:hypothetical protein